MKRRGEWYVVRKDKGVGTWGVVRNDKGVVSGMWYVTVRDELPRHRNEPLTTNHASDC